MKKLVNLVFKSWMTIAVLSLIAGVLVSPWFVADFGDEILVLIYCLIMAPVLVGAVGFGCRPFLGWLKN